VFEFDGGGRSGAGGAAAPHNRVRVRVLVVGSIVGEVRRVLGGGEGWWLARRVAANWRGRCLGHGRRAGARGRRQTMVEYMATFPQGRV
jgi:hypothetical protein